MKITYMEGDQCPKCLNGTLETYDNDKEGCTVLYCPDCETIISKAPQQ